MIEIGEPVQVVVPTSDAMIDFGRALGRLLQAGDLLVLAGPLGAGKTTLVQGIAAGLGVLGRVISPTFVLAREHRSAGGGPTLVHVDAYRLGGLAELDDLDLDSDLEDSVTAVEWGTGLVEVLATDRLEITIGRPAGSDHRVVTLLGHGPSWLARASGLHGLRATDG